jgi:predicted anti-sigma-YlaC factor YlaD
LEDQVVANFRRAKQVEKFIGSPAPRDAARRATVANIPTEANAMTTPAPTPRRPAATLVLSAALGLLLSGGCSLNRIAINKLGNALAESGTTFSADADPELVGAAIPFSLKLVESLLASAPEHRGLLFAAASGFTMYSYAYVEQRADMLEDRDLAQAMVERGRARRLYLRARGYGLRGLATRHQRFGERLRADPGATMREATAADVPLLYWTAAAWGSAIALSKENPELIADQPLVEALIDRALELDERFDAGAIHGFLISYEMARQGARGDPAVRARAHFERAVSLSDGKMASPYVSFAEAVCVQRQDRREFESMLQRALAVNPDDRPEWRLANLIMQRRARWLLARVDQLFLEEIR